jgi:hypothetical protein
VSDTTITARDDRHAPLMFSRFDHAPCREIIDESNHVAHRLLKESYTGRNPRLSNRAAASDSGLRPLPGEGGAHRNRSGKSRDYETGRMSVTTGAAGRSRSGSGISGRALATKISPCRNRPFRAFIRFLS